VTVTTITAVTCIRYTAGKLSFAFHRDFFSGHINITHGHVGKTLSRAGASPHVCMEQIL